MAGLFVVAAMVAVYKHEVKQRFGSKKQRQLDEKYAAEEQQRLTQHDSIFDDAEADNKIDVSGWSEMSDRWRPESISYSTSIIQATGRQTVDTKRKQLFALQIY